MFAYCGNAPVVNYDPAGNYYVSAEDRITTGCGGRGGVPVPPTKHNVPDKNTGGHSKLEEVFLYITNSDEQVVLNAEYIAFYNGVPVIKLPIGTDAFSFGVIFLGNDVGKRKDPIATVRHEYGHALHLRLAGEVSYTVFAFVPSVVGHHFGGEEYQKNYYSQIYEYTADILGNVSRPDYTYSPTTENWFATYLLFTMLFS